MVAFTFLSLSTLVLATSSALAAPFLKPVTEWTDLKPFEQLAIDAVTRDPKETADLYLGDGHYMVNAEKRFYSIEGAR